ncbi:MAG: TIR domain-containing protein [bacterium]|nr:TIR domain-containing protein [bacterium]
MDRHDVFISYNSQDRDAALELDGQLRTLGFRPWIAVHDAVPGQRWLDQLERIIESTPAVLVLVGASGLGPWETEEIAAALQQAVKRKVPVVPVFMKGAPPEVGPTSLPLFRGVRVGVDLRTESLYRLVKLLGQAVGLPPAAAGGGQGSGNYFESSLIRWLHLSDFHVGKDDYAQHRIFEQIHRHVREGVDDKGTPDLVFVTGDIAHRGKAEEYATFYEDFLRPLVEALGADWDGMIYTIPGNHDVDRSVARYFDSKAICKPSSRFFDASSEGSQQREMLLPRFRAYLEAEKQQGNDSPNGWLTSTAGAFSERREVRGRSLGIVGVNTAWLCQDEDDRHQLTPGIALLEEALGRVRDCEVCIVLGHHPLDWLHDDHIGPIRALLGECHALYLHGHLHRSQGQRESGAGKGFLAVQAGSCFQARDGEPWINGLLWAELDLEHWELRLQPRHWNVQNRDWPLTSGAFPERLRQEGTDWWCFSLPGAGVGVDLKSSTIQTGGAPRPTAADDTSRRAAPHPVVAGALESTVAPPALSRIAPPLSKKVPSSPSPPASVAAQVPVVAPQVASAENRPSTPKHVVAPQSAPAGDRPSTPKPVAPSPPSPKRVVPVVEPTPVVERVAPPSTAPPPKRVAREAPTPPTRRTKMKARRGELARERIGDNARRWGLVSGLVGAVVVVVVLTVWPGRLSDLWNAVFPGPPEQAVENSDSVDRPMTEREEKSNELIGPSSEIALVANFTFSPERPVAGQQVQFTATSTGNPTTWEWDFENPPNGTDSKLQNPTWTFEHPGTYPVKLTASSPQVDIDPVTTNVVVGPPGDPGELSFSRSSYQVSEDIGTASIAVRRTGGSDGVVSVRCNTAGGTAVAGQDYVAPRDILSWAAGNTANEFCTIPIINDTEQEGNETINISLTHFTGAAPAPPTTAILTILANDSQVDYSASLLKVVGLSDNISIVEEPGSSYVLSKMEPLKHYFVLEDTGDYYRISSDQEESDIWKFVSKKEVAIWNTRGGLQFVAATLLQHRQATVAAWESEDRIRLYAKTLDENAYGPTFKELPHNSTHAIIPYPLLDTKEIEGRDGETRRIHQVLIPTIVAGTLDPELPPGEVRTVAGAVTFCVVFDATASMARYAKSFAQAIDEMLAETDIDTGLAAAGFVLFRDINNVQRFEIVHPMPLDESMTWLRGRIRHMEGGNDPAEPVLDAMMLAKDRFLWNGGTAIRGARRVAIVVANKDAKLQTVDLTGEGIIERGLSAEEVGRRLQKDGISVFTFQAGFEDRGNLVRTLSTLSEETGGEFYAAERSRKSFSEKLKRIVRQRIAEGGTRIEDLEPHMIRRTGGGTVIALHALDKAMRDRLKVAAREYHISSGGLVITGAWVFEKPGLYREEILVEKELLEWLVRFFDGMTDSTLDAALLRESVKLLEELLGIHYTSKFLGCELERLTALSPEERSQLRERIRTTTGALADFLDLNAKRFNTEPRIWMPVEFLP